MGIKITFTCNICHQQYTRTDGKSKIPLGWGAVRPTLRVSLPSLHDGKDMGMSDREWYDYIELRDNLKKKLWENEYHICPDCLKLSQREILRIEQGKKHESNSDSSRR